MEDIPSNIIEAQIDKMSKTLDTEVLKALKVHGYETTKETVKEFVDNNNCRLLSNDGLNTLIVNDVPICCYTEWELEPFDFTKEYKVNAHFKFSIL